MKSLTVGEYLEPLLLIISQKVDFEHSPPLVEIGALTIDDPSSTSSPISPQALYLMVEYIIDQFVHLHHTRHPFLGIGRPCVYIGFCLRDSIYMHIQDKGMGNMVISLLVSLRDILLPCDTCLVCHI